MNPHIVHILLLTIFLPLTGCEDDPPGLANDDAVEWLIPVDDVFDGGPGKDGIPAVMNPRFQSVQEHQDLEDDELVVGVIMHDEARAYPHTILDWHEIINDEIQGTPISLTYCPLTGSAIGWHGNINGQTTTFGVSGLLYNSNLMPYDRATDSYWSQMLLQAVHGARKGEMAETFPVLETSWKQWKTLFPESRVLTRETGHSRPYGNYPYGDYRTSEGTIFPVRGSDGRLHPKERVHGIIVGGGVHAYVLEDLPPALGTLQDELNMVPYVLVGSGSANIVAVFDRRLNDGTSLNFHSLTEGDPGQFTDEENNIWDLSGRAVAGPRLGQQLTPLTAFTAYWLAWPAFYPNISIKTM